MVKSSVAPSVAVYDLSGRQVAVLPLGASGYVWDGRDGAGVLQAPGVYLLVVEVEAEARTDRQLELVHLVY